MGLIQTGDKFVQYRYKIEEFKILFADKTIDIEPIKIIGMGIEHDYELAIFPLFKITMVLDPKNYYKIIKEKNTVKFKIRVQKYYRYIDSGKRSLNTDVVNDTFSLFLPDNTSNFSESIDTKIKDKNMNEYFSENAVDFFMFKDKIVNNIRKDSNKVISRADMTNVLAWLFYKAKIQNVLMSPLDNNTKYHNVIIPPMSIIDIIQYLDTQYGFYKTGCLLYFGLMYTYLLRYDGKCTAWRKKEWKDTVIYILEKSNTSSTLSGAILRNDDEKYYINVQSEYVNINNITIATNVIGGTNIDVVNADQDSVDTSNSGAATKNDTNYSKTIQNDSNNRYIASTYAAQTAANSVIIDIAMGDFNLDAIEPNKATSIIFEDTKLNSKYKGNYKVSKAYIKFLKDGEDFSLETSVSYKKMK